VIETPVIDWAPKILSIGGFARFERSKFASVYYKQVQNLPFAGLKILISSKLASRNLQNSG